MPIFKESNINREILNISIFAGLLIIFIFIWELVFISCKSITKITLKDIELTTQEFQEATKTIKSKVEDLNTLEHIIRVQWKMYLHMRKFYQRMKSLDDSMYTKLIRKYAKARGNIKISCYPYSQEGLEKMKSENHLDNISFSSVYYSLESQGICLPPNMDGSESDKLYAVVTASFMENGLLLVIQGERIIKNEHLIIQNIIFYFDSILELEGQKIKLDELKQNTLKSD